MRWQSAGIRPPTVVGWLVSTFSTRTQAAACVCASGQDRIPDASADARQALILSPAYPRVPKVIGVHVLRRFRLRRFRHGLTRDLGSSRHFRRRTGDGRTTAGDVGRGGDAFRAVPAIRAGAFAAAGSPRGPVQGDFSHFPSDPSWATSGGIAARFQWVGIYRIFRIFRRGGRAREVSSAWRAEIQGSSMARFPSSRSRHVPPRVASRAHEPTFCLADRPPADAVAIPLAGPLSCTKVASTPSKTSSNRIPAIIAISARRFYARLDQISHRPAKRYQLPRYVLYPPGASSSGTW